MGKLELRDGIAALQEMLASETDYRENWSPDLIFAMERKIYPTMPLDLAWKVIPKAKIAAVLDAVRNRLLSFLLELKAQHPEVEDADVNLSSVPEDFVRVSFTNIIQGGGNVIASGGTVHQGGGNVTASGETVHLQVSQGVTRGDLESLLSALREASLTEEQISELAVAIEEDEPNRAGGIGAKTGGWLARLGEKAATSTVATFAAQALFRYYGIAGT